MTREGFAKWLRPWIDEGIAFTAYWHPSGFGRLRTASIPTERKKYILHEPKKKDRVVTTAPKYGSPFWTTPGCWAEPITEPGPPKTLRKGTLNKWHANIEKLRRSSWEEVITVDFDSRNIMTEGGELPL